MTLTEMVQRVLKAERNRPYCENRIICRVWKLQEQEQSGKFDPIQDGARASSIMRIVYRERRKAVKHNADI